MLEKILGKAAWWLTIIGALNWGLVGALKMDLVATIFGAGSLLSTIVYIVVGLSAIYLLIQAFKKSK